MSTTYGYDAPVFSPMSFGGLLDSSEEGSKIGRTDVRAAGLLQGSAQLTDQLQVTAAHRILARLEGAAIVSEGARGEIAKGLQDGNASVREVVRRLLEEGRVSNARSLVRLFQELPELARLRHVLEPPMAKVRVAVDRDRAAEFEWLRASSEPYRGRWVALLGNAIEAEAATLRELRHDLRRRGIRRAPLVHRIS